MKKFQTMMAVVLVALMAFAVQSCGSDDNDPEYKLAVTLDSTNQGPLTDAQVALMKQDAAKGSTVAAHPTDASAETATMRAAQLIAEALELNKATYGSAEFMYTLVCTKVSGNKQIITYYVAYEAGDVEIYSNKNAK